MDLRVRLFLANFESGAVWILYEMGEWGGSWGVLQP